MADGHRDHGPAVDAAPFRARTHGTHPARATSPWPDRGCRGGRYRGSRADRGGPRRPDAGAHRVPDSVRPDLAVPVRGSSRTRQFGGPGGCRDDQAAGRGLGGSPGRSRDHRVLRSADLQRAAAVPLSGGQSVPHHGLLRRSARQRHRDVHGRRTQSARRPAETRSTRHWSSPASGPGLTRSRSGPSRSAEPRITWPQLRPTCRHARRPGTSWRATRPSPSPPQPARRCPRATSTRGCS